MLSSAVSVSALTRDHFCRELASVDFERDRRMPALVLFGFQNNAVGCYRFYRMKCPKTLKASVLASFRTAADQQPAQFRASARREPGGRSVCRDRCCDLLGFVMGCRDESWDP